MNCLLGWSLTPRRRRWVGPGGGRWPGVRTRASWAALCGTWARCRIAVMRPVRRFAWSARQRHRPGLQFMVSTGRHHGFESLAKQRLLLVLDFAGEVVQVLGQPFRLRFTVGGQRRDHVPDVLAVTRQGVWLFDVRPADRVREQDLAGFAAAARVAAEVGWRYAVVTGWRPNVPAGVEGFSAQRRPLADASGCIHYSCRCPSTCVTPWPVRLTMPSSPGRGCMRPAA
ncbi:TnsA-like heteromeric transposase endonuclease subunit [Dactylosporangium sp. NPDC049742]|uniref:TnsA-like heteromeric transposase endonuclease subunit n=1 Tax=Dactylosporangium sp. NPDC049742 TaxID=3154737 RepID=UPI00341B531C